MNHGSLGICDCGYIAIARCQSCGAMLCESHVAELPAPPEGVSENAQIKFGGAIRMLGGEACVACRAEQGLRAISQAIGAPRAPLPNHWLDRAIALASDQTRSIAERNFDGRLPSSLTANEVAAEFLRRMTGKEPRESVAVTEATWMHKAEIAYGWKIERCRRTDYTHQWPGGGSERCPLPMLISVAGELLGPTLEDDQTHSATWFIVPGSDIDLDRLVSCIAGLMILSPFEA